MPLERFEAPDFSVVVPTRNRPGMLARALRSVLAQSGPSFEIIVADDGAGQGAACARALLGAGAAFETGGLGQVPARILALRRARGRWIAFLDDDDWWDSPLHLAAMKVALGAGGGLAYASGAILRETPEGRTTGQMRFTAYADPESLRLDNTLLVSGIAYEAALHAALGDFDAGLPVYWDWDWYLRLAAAGIRFVDSLEDGVRISTRTDNVSSTGNEAARGAELIRLCAKHGLKGVRLKNHESIAAEQQGRGAAEPP